MSSPQGPGPHPQQGNPAEPPAEQPTWGTPPPGGWGQSATEAIPQTSEAKPDTQDAGPEADRTQAIDPRVWSQQVGVSTDEPTTQKPLPVPQASDQGVDLWSKPQQEEATTRVVKKPAEQSSPQPGQQAHSEAQEDPPTTRAQWPGQPQQSPPQPQPQQQQPQPQAGQQWGQQQAQDTQAAQQQWGQQQAAWGQQQPGQQQWGQQQAAAPQWGQQQADQQWQQHQQQQPYGQQPYGAQQGQQAAPQQPAPQWAGQQQAWGSQQGQQQAWGQQQAPQSAAQPAQQWGTPPQQQAHPQQQAWSPSTPSPSQGAGQQSYPPLPEQSSSSDTRSKTPLIVGAVGLLVVVLIGVLGFVTPGWFVTRVFDTAAVQAGVQKVLTDNYGMKVTAVKCGPNIQVTEGAQFRCDATVDGGQVSVPIRVTSSSGDYEVGRPL